MTIVLVVATLAGLLAWQWRARFFAGLGDTPRSGASSVAWLDRVAWAGSPGPLTAAHATLSSDCQACHVPFRRVADAKCLACHAKNTELLQRLDTVFHASATRCLTCHVEHQGRAGRISRMEHGVLAPDVACSSCHVDRHQARFGDRCADCHSVETWRIAGFRHPSGRSRFCVECHQAPPSHFMMHFEMVDKALTEQADATVDQCWRCHTTDDWNNIKGVGFYRHH